MLRHALLAATYADSVVLMQLQRALAATPGVFAAAAVMATPANRELLAAQALLPAEAAAARPDDLLVAVRAASAAAAEAALRRVPELLRGERGAEGGAEHRVRSLAAALRELPEAGWVAISVPGRWAGAVAREALAQGRHVFLFSDNVPLEEEVALKAEAVRRGLLLLGPDCGTALIGGVGLGFANRVRRGPVGIVAASGTGLQAVACSVHARGGGVSHALGTGGRDFGEAVGGATALQALDLLRRDPQTDVVALLGKPPAARVAARLLQAAGACGKPVVAWFLGSAAASRRVGDVWFATSSAEAAELAAGLVGGTGEEGRGEGAAAATSRLHGLFAGGTLAQEALLGLLPWLGPIASNLSLPGALPLADPAAGGAHLLLDLGADEMTVGRPHPMLDEGVRRERLAAAAADPDVALVLLDLVLGDGAHPDPAGELAPAIRAARQAAAGAGRPLDVVAILVGTDDDPQGLGTQAERLQAAGARVVRSVGEAVQYAVATLSNTTGESAGPAVPLDALAAPVVVNVGLEGFHRALAAQGARSIQVDWRPPAGGDERLGRLLERMR